MPNRYRYRLLTGTDDSSFCRKISEALDDGYRLYGPPIMTALDGRITVGQAVVLTDGNGDHDDMADHDDMTDQNRLNKEEAKSSGRR